MRTVKAYKGCLATDPQRRAYFDAMYSKYGEIAVTEAEIRQTGRASVTVGPRGG